jgi:hypothetical protein
MRIINNTRHWVWRWPFRDSCYCWDIGYAEALCDFRAMRHSERCYFIPKLSLFTSHHIIRSSVLYADNVLNYPPPPPEKEKENWIMCSRKQLDSQLRFCLQISEFLKDARLASVVTFHVGRLCFGCGGKLVEFPLTDVPFRTLRRCVCRFIHILREECGIINLSRLCNQARY